MEALYSFFCFQELRLHFRSFGHYKLHKANLFDIYQDSGIMLRQLRLKIYHYSIYIHLMIVAGLVR